MEDVANPQLVFYNTDGKDLETVFVTYIPVSMVKELIKDKNWKKDDVDVPDYEAEEKERLEEEKKLEEEKHDL